MNPLSLAFRRVFRRPVTPNGSKALTIIRHPGDETWAFEQPNFTGRVSTGVTDAELRSSVVTACLNWLMRTFPEAPPIVQRRDTGGLWRTVDDHPLTTLLRQPNAFYSGRVLLMATVLDFAFGEAFWLKVRDGLGRVRELWWAPRNTITPRWPDYDRTVFISHYDYTTGGTVVHLPPEDVVHFRFGLNPANIRRGFSQLAAVMQDVFTDEQASTYTATVLRNLGVIGMVISPKEGTASDSDVKEVKQYLEENFTGLNRGKPLALGRPTTVDVLQHNLNGLDLGPLRDVSEERVCAALGIPAAVVGFGTGLQQTKVGATMRELIQLAWKGAIMPQQEIFADELNRSLLPEFQANPSIFRTGFDASAVRALWEDVAGKHDRVRKDWESNLILQSEARRELGYEVTPEHDRYFRDMVKPAAPAPGDDDGAGGEGGDDGGEGQGGDDNDEGE